MFNPKTRKQGEPSATIGQAETREECEALIEYDFDYHRLRGHEIVDAEACEICAECDGEGLIAAGNDGQVICPACDGHHGPLRKDQGRLSSLSARAPLGASSPPAKSRFSNLAGKLVSVARNGPEPARAVWSDPLKPVRTQ